MPKETNKECKVHGLTAFTLEGRGYYRCKKCRVKNVTEQRKRNKLRLVKEFGGKCKGCGYDKCPDVLHFHHLNSNEKSFGMSEGGATRSYALLVEEAKKCILLCANCHGEVEAGVRFIPG